MEEAREAVKALFELRDGYLDTRGVETIGQKPSLVQAEIEKALQAIKEAGDETTNDSELLFLKGKALNVAQAYNADAERLLAKAVKLDPKNIDGWNELGECFWKKGDKTQAHTCLKRSLEVSENKVGLQKLSMLLRQLPTESELEKYNNITNSLEMARNAIKADVKDGHSWFILGNAYLALFFARMESIDDVKRALQAYKRAETDKREAVNNPDLHYNRATVHEYQEDYGLAVEGYSLAALLDPDWPDPKAASERIKSRCLSIQDHIDSNGKIKGKKLNALVESLKSSGGDGLSEIPVSKLEEGVNGMTTCRLKIVKIFSSDTPPQTFLAVDKEGSLACLTIYNMVPDVINSSDVVVVPEPFFRRIKIAFAEDKCDFASIRVDNPVTVRVNGKALGTDGLVKSALTITAKSE